VPKSAANLTPAAWRLRALALLLFSLGCLAALFYLFQSITQDPGYYQFADAREILGIPYGLNVLSNLGFALVGLAGLSLVFHRRPGEESCYRTGWEQAVYGLLFTGVLATGFGSAWFHHRPDIHTLFWDRLPMTLAFMPLLALITAERMGLPTAQRMLPLLLLLGPGSVFYWAWGQAHGAEDLRLYVFVQFFPLLAIPLLIVLFPPRYTRAFDLVWMVLWYIAAKLFEQFDAQIYGFGHIVSGHTLKHLAAAVATWFIYRQLKLRRPL
jgi:hypothetical protein